MAPSHVSEPGVMNVQMRARGAGLLPCMPGSILWLHRPGPGSEPMQTAPRRFPSIPRFLERISGLTAGFLILAYAGAMLTPARGDGVGPLSMAKTGHFFVGGKYVDTQDGRVLAGQAYVEYYIPTNRTHLYPIVMIEGCC